MEKYHEQDSAIERKLRSKYYRTQSKNGATLKCSWNLACKIKKRWIYYSLGLHRICSKEIEISFPSSGDTDYDFTRRLVDTPGVVPHDVALQVLSPC